MEERKYLVAVVGAGPAGIYAAKKLASLGAQVVIFNRDIKPGGLAEYGIFYSKYRMKSGLRKQFHKILADENITYYGNIRIGDEGDLTLDDLRQLGFQAIMVTVGAQGTKSLGLPGEHLRGVLHAKDLVYHYNKLPPFSQQEFAVGKRVALIGVGNVMVDLAHWLARDKQVEQIVAVARRGPAEVKFARKEFEYVADYLDLEALNAEIERVSEYMEIVDQDPQAAKDFILGALPKAKPATSQTRLTFQFLSSPKEILDDQNGNVRGLVVNDTKLIIRQGKIVPHRMSSTQVLDVDTVIFCIGDKVDESFGLPTQWNAFVKHPAPCFPIGEKSYEAYDPHSGRAIEDVFVAGWSREASNGLVGYARKDGEAGSQALWQYLRMLSPREDIIGILNEIESAVREIRLPVIDATQIVRLTEIEESIARERGLEGFKFESNDEMLNALTERILG